MTRRLLALAFLSVWMALPIYAESSDTRATVQFTKACGLTGTDTSVTIAVYDDAAPGSLMTTITNADIDQIGTEDCYQTDLAATIAAIAYPVAADGTYQGWTLIWTDDVVNTVMTEEFSRSITGAAALSGGCEKVTPVYPTISIPSRGITPQVIAAGKPNYMTVEGDCSRVFSSSTTYYEVFAYDGSGRVESRTPSATIPSP
jgi:hypothetical protein